MKKSTASDISSSGSRCFPKSSYSNEYETKFQPQSTQRAAELYIDMNNLEVNDFATGWLKGGNVLGRPVDIITNDDGSLFVSDDNAGEVFEGVLWGVGVLDFCFYSELRMRNLPGVVRKNMDMALRCIL